MTTTASAKTQCKGLGMAAAMVEKKRTFDTAFKLKVTRDVANDLLSLLRSPESC